MHLTPVVVAASAKLLGIRLPVMKSQLLYPQYFYWYLLASNAVLRLSWTYKLSPHLRGNYNTVMLFTVLEVAQTSSYKLLLHLLNEASPGS